MPTVSGERISHRNEVLLKEAIEDAIAHAPTPGQGTDVQTFKLSSVEIITGGFVLSTTTKVTLEIT